MLFSIDAHLFFTYYFASPFEMDTSGMYTVGAQNNTNQ